MHSLSNDSQPAIVIVTLLRLNTNIAKPIASHRQKWSYETARTGQPRHSMHSLAPAFNMESCLHPGTD